MSTIISHHFQLIYDFKDGAGSIGLITMHPDEIEDADKERFLNIGIEIPTMRLVLVCFSYYIRFLLFSLRENHIPKIN